jgi:hypothetical protein
MPRAIPYPIRQEIIQRHQAGQSLRAIAQVLQVSYRSVRTFWQRYCATGDAGLQTNYAQCGSSHPAFALSVQDAALTFKRDHPSWGAGLILLQLRKQFPSQPLPSWRTLQRWWQHAGLQPPRHRVPAPQRSRGSHPHAVWQLDAKEQIQLLDGSWSCVVSVVDEASGAVLAATAFPPTSVDTGAAA